MTWVLDAGRGVGHDGDGAPPALTGPTREALAEWHALARADRGVARELVVARAHELAAVLERETGEPARVVDPGRGSDPGGEPVPWGPGLLLALLCAVLVTVAVSALGPALARLSPVLAVVVVSVVLLGLAPTVLRHRQVPVRRWFVAGGLLGAALGWVGVLAAALL